MKINDVTDGEKKGMFDSDERLDILTLREADIVKKVCFVSNVVEGRDRNTNRMVTLSLKDKRGTSIACFSFNLNNEVTFEKILSLKNKVVLLNAQVNVHKGAYVLHLIDCIPYDKTGYTKTDFLAVNKNIEGQTELLNTILDKACDVEYLAPVVGHIRKLGLVDILKNHVPDKYVNLYRGDGLEALNKICSTLIQDGFETEEGIDVGLVGSVLLCLSIGLQNFIKTRVDDSAELINTSHMNSITLFDSLVKTYKLFEGDDINKAIRLEFKHMYEVFLGISEPKTLLAHYVKNNLDNELRNLSLRNTFLSGKRGNRYLIDGFEINRVL